MKAATARALTLPGLLLGLVLTSTLPAWAGATSARPAAPVNPCVVDAARTGDASEGPRC